MKTRDPRTPFASLVSLVKQLRKKCPWDKKQTPQSIKTYLLLEAYEAFEAVSEKKWESLKDELGDLLFQVIFHAKMAEEKKRFTLSDILTALNQKLTSRHPHVFGKTKVQSAKEQTQRWDELKQAENQKSLLHRVPKKMSALLQSYELQTRVHRAGFQWNNLKEVSQKIEEEWGELNDACQTRKKTKMEEELGDFLFVITEYARWLNLNPEEALLKANSKFRKRFLTVERLLKKQGKSMKECSTAELEALWQKAKRRNHGT